MKWKILIKFLYLVALLAFIAWETKPDNRLIDSDPAVDEPALLHASLQE